MVELALPREAESSSDLSDWQEQSSWEVEHFATQTY